MSSCGLLPHLFLIISCGRIRKTVIKFENLPFWPLSDVYHSLIAIYCQLIVALLYCYCMTVKSRLFATECPVSIVILNWIVKLNSFAFEFEMSVMAERAALA